MNKPHVIIVEDFPAHLQLMATLFTLHGCSVSTANSLFRGMEVIYDYLRPPRSYTPTVIVIDVNLPRAALELQGTVLIAQISEDCERNHIMPCWIAGISQEMDEARERELRLAGAHFVFSKPLMADNITQLFAVIEAPPTIVYPANRDFTTARQTVRSTSRQLLSMLELTEGQTATKLVWEPLDVRSLLFRPHLLSDAHKRYVHTVGGVQRMRAQLQLVDVDNRPELLFLRDAILSADSAGWDWQHYIEVHQLSQTTYYRYVNSLIASFAHHLNTWD